MSANVKNIFLVLVFVQALHSIEEYLGELWNELPPAKFLCSLVSDNLETGFLVINIGLFVAGILVWFFLVRTGHPFARVFIWFWILLELTNGLGHTFWSLIRQAYRPGLITAPFLFIIALYLAIILKIPTDDDKAHFSRS